METHPILMICLDTLVSEYNKVYIIYENTFFLNNPIRLGCIMDLDHDSSN